MGFITELEMAFTANANPVNARAMAKYMKNHFSFLGLKTDLRRSLLKEIWKKNKAKVQQNYRDIAVQLFEKEYREYHYCAVELLIKELKNNFRKEDIQWIEQFIVTNSWWDTVDVLAKYILGGYLQALPQQTTTTIARFSDSDNLWLNRSAILFQLSYKEKTIPEYLFSECKKQAEAKDFFIQKAIGWALREYAKTNPKAVLDFVAKTPLKPLSKREALKHF